MDKCARCDNDFKPYTYKHHIDIDGNIKWKSCLCIGCGLVSNTIHLRKVEELDDCYVIGGLKDE